MRGLRGLAGLAGCLLALGLTAGTARAGDDVTPEALAAVERELEGLRAEPAVSTEQVVTHLVALGSDHLGALITVCEDARPGGREEAVLRAAVAHHGPRSLQAYLTRRLGSGATAAEALDVLAVLSVHGDLHSLAFALELVRGLDPTWLPTKRVQRAWEAALVTLIAADCTPNELARVLRAVPAALTEPTAAALGRLGGRASVGALVALIGADPEDAAPLYLALSRARRLALAQEGVAAVIGAGLALASPDARAAAAQLAAR
ncbi:MAG: hypothetical protein O2894_12525, partial [Planctomycetota bacterium]|nr:hypothetical protein [Planctomycetota bacterium]